MGMCHGINGWKRPEYLPCDQSLGVRETGHVHTHHPYTRPPLGEFKEDPTINALSPTEGVAASRGTRAAHVQFCPDEEKARGHPGHQSTLLDTTKS